MTVIFLILLVLVLAAAGYILARMRAVTMAGGDARKLHSLPGYYGWHAFCLTAIPALAILAAWLVVQPIIVAGIAGRDLPQSLFADASARKLALEQVRAISEGLSAAVAAGSVTFDGATELLATGADPAALLEAAYVSLQDADSFPVVEAVRSYSEANATGIFWRALAVAAAALAGLAYALSRTSPDLRARNRVEGIVLGILMAASGIAILTTIGIIWSMLSESIRFFGMYPVGDFFFGLTWSPNFRGSSEFGLLPLLWGTLYITLIAMVVAIPLGLFAAIYLAEYADARMRAWIKPTIELIAGIPTVVFGLFALVTVGPFLRDWFAQPLGLGSSGSSVMTAGIVIGILNIPFISSLADDIINAVPQSLRDGSYGLGATRSETIRQVVLPAALPGIVGACLMAASRAIGETMIVTMGAGAAARMDLNPFEAMTTITVKIVSQLTGDSEFNSPETLVAFALGMTLFVITLALNVFALWIVRRYREQYE